MPRHQDKKKHNNRPEKPNLQTVNVSSGASNETAGPDTIGNLPLRAELPKDKPELSTMERIAIPGLLVGALYSAYATALSGLRYNNETRNTILQIGVYPKPADAIPKVHAELLFYSDWIPILVGNCVYALLIGIVIWWVPGFVMQHRDLTPEMKKKISILRWFCVLLPAVGFLGTLIGGWLDFRQIRDYVSHLK